MIGLRAFGRRIAGALAALLRQGASAEKLALALAIGLVVGVFPVLGTTAILCTIAAMALRLNLVAVQTVHYAVTPLQVLLIIPFVRVGEHVVGAAPQPLTIGGGLQLIQAGIGPAIVKLWSAILHGIAGWLVVAPLALGLGFLIARCVLRRIAAVRGASTLPSSSTRGA